MYENMYENIIHFMYENIILMRPQRNTQVFSDALYWKKKKK